MRQLNLKVSPIFIIALVALAIAIGSWGFRNSRNDVGQGSVATSKGAPQEFDKVFEVYETLKREHLFRDSLDPEVLSQGAVRGMLGALEDPYASYLTPQQHSVEAQDFKGFFEGIGSEVTIRDGQIIIVAPLPETPTEKAGIRPGDIILEIDGESTEGLSLLEVVNKIRGPKGMSVDLVILHESGGEPVRLTIVRDVIKVSSVRLRMLSGRVAHVRITSFNGTTSQELADVLRKVDEFDARGIILDVRNNPGGLLDAVVQVTSQFVDGGLVLYEVNGQGKRSDWKARSGGLATEIPLVILMNQYSASGSEVMAGALMDRGRATTIGVTTFGKGSVNTLRRLSDGSGLYYTIGRWYTPNGTIIEGEGLAPDITVENPEDASEDLQLDRATEFLLSEVTAGE